LELLEEYAEPQASKGHSMSFGNEEVILAEVIAVQARKENYL
jgi:hypothetical protein